MTEAVIVSACRTAIGTAIKGTLLDTNAYDLAEAVVKEALSRSGLEGADIDDVILAETMYGGGVIARHAAITSGLVNAPGMALNRHCAAGLSAISVAASDIKSGMSDAIIAGGVMSMSTGPLMRMRKPGTAEFEDMWISPSHPGTEEAPNRDMGITVGWNTAVKAGLTREEIDLWAYESHMKASAARADGRLAEEIVPMKVTKFDGTQVIWDTDEHPRADTTLEKLASLKTLHPEIEGFSITAGNAAGINDAAAAVVIVSDELAKAKGLTVLATVRSWTSVAVAPEDTGLAPIQAIPKALAKAGLTVQDVDLFEINEAFASVPVAAVKALGLDKDKVNPVGSGCSLGHPIAASGARMVVSLIHELRRRGGGIGVAAMCAGGGMGAAVVIEVPAP